MLTISSSCFSGACINNFHLSRMGNDAPAFNFPCQQLPNATLRGSSITPRSVSVCVAFCIINVLLSSVCCRRAFIFLHFFFGVCISFGCKGGHVYVDCRMRSKTIWSSTPYEKETKLLICTQANIFNLHFRTPFFFIFKTMMHIDIFYTSKFSRKEQQLFTQSTHMRCDIKTMCV